MVDWANVIIQGLAIILSLAAFIVLFIILHWLAKHRNPKSVRVCPKCGSTNHIHLKKGPDDTYFVASIRGSNYYDCLDCNFSGVFPLIDKNKLDSFRKSLKENKNV